MFQKIKDLYNYSSEKGIRLPFAYDGEKKGPSLTLLVFYMMFVLNIVSLTALHFNKDLWVATSYSLMAWIMSFVFYKLRRLDNVKLNLRKGEVELDSDDEKN